MAIDALVDQVRDHPRALTQLALQLLGSGEHSKALLLAEKALGLATNDREIASLVTTIKSHSVPDWHFYIVQDEARNSAYDESIRRAVRPGARVLDIGAGTGLLAMMAARAGGTEIISCEMNPIIASAARDIVAANGFSDAISVVSKHSDDLDMADLGGPADVLVSEIVSNNMLSERVLPALESVCRRLLAPDATIIPDRAIIRIALAEDVARNRRLMSDIKGFDLSAFNRLAKPLYPVQTNAGRVALRSAAADLFSFDFRPHETYRPARTRLELEATGGPINGIVQWIKLRLDADNWYENDPECGFRSAWALLFHPLPEPIAPEPGKKVIVGASHDTVSLRIWTE